MLPPHHTLLSSDQRDFSPARRYIGAESVSHVGRSPPSQSLNNLWLLSPYPQFPSKRESRGQGSILLSFCASIPLESSSLAAILPQRDAETSFLTFHVFRHGCTHGRCKWQAQCSTVSIQDGQNTGRWFILSRQRVRSHRHREIFRGESNQQAFDERS